MTHVLNLSRDDPVIYLKAYGGVRIRGVDSMEVVCKIDSPQLATLVEEDGDVYVTINTSCILEVPEPSSIKIERAMGSVLIEQVKNPINIDKVLGNLTLIGVGQVDVGKVGGNLSAQHIAGHLNVSKIGGKLTVDDAQSITCEKLGGSCILRQIYAEARIGKAGGSCLVQDISGEAYLARFGGSLKARGINLSQDVKVGGNIEIIDCRFVQDLQLSAGGNITVALNKAMTDMIINITSDKKSITIAAFGEEIKIKDYKYKHQFGNGNLSLNFIAGGSVLITEETDSEVDFIGDLSDRFTFEESAFSEMIQQRIDSATRRAEAKIKNAEIRLGLIQDRIEKIRNTSMDMNGDNDGDEQLGSDSTQPLPSVTHPAGKKGATDEERLMILNMLQNGTITVDEAEALFRAMER